MELEIRKTGKKLKFFFIFLLTDKKIDNYFRYLVV